MKTALSKASRVAAAVSLVGIGSVVWSAQAQAGTAAIVGQGTYLCQSAPQGLPMETYNVTIRMSFPSAPTSLAPGQTVSLSGTMTMQWDEKAYQEGKSLGETEADGYSNTLSVATTVNGKTVDNPANRWQTAPFAWNDPVVISAPITIQPFTVPANASGSIAITLPRNERAAPNTASGSPATVAFNGVADNKTAAGTISENIGCYLQGTAPSTIATIPITTAASGGTTANTPASGTTGRAPGPAGAAAAATAGLPAAAAGAAPSASAGAQDPGAVAAGGGASADQGTGAAGAYSNDATRTGVFIPTDLLILSGGLICAAALAYAVLTQYRLRNIRRAIDG